MHPATNLTIMMGIMSRFCCNPWPMLQFNCMKEYCVKQRRLFSLSSGRSLIFLWNVYELGWHNIFVTHLNSIFFSDQKSQTPKSNMLWRKIHIFTFLLFRQQIPCPWFGFVSTDAVFLKILTKKNGFVLFFFNGDVQDQNPPATHLSMCNLLSCGSNFAKPFQDHFRTVLHLEHRLIVSVTVFHVTVAAPSSPISIVEFLSVKSRTILILLLHFIEIVGVVCPSFYTFVLCDSF